LLSATPNTAYRTLDLLWCIPASSQIAPATE
jgi:hypothetical protein